MKDKGFNKLAATLVNKIEIEIGFAIEIEGFPDTDSDFDSDTDGTPPMLE